MKVWEGVFSPTGGTKKVADIITQTWDLPTEQLDLTDPHIDFSAVTIAPEDFVLVAVPAYGGRVPAPAISRIARLEGNNAQCVLVCVYGNRAYEDTLIELADTVESAGFRIAAAIAAIAEHSIMHQYAAGRPDAEDEVQLRAMASKVLARLQTTDAQLALSDIPGNRPYKQFGGIPLVPKAGNACISCAVCAKGCPVEAIDVANLQDADKEKCITCMRCVAACPQNARRVNKTLVAATALRIKKACAERKKNELFI